MRLAGREIADYRAGGILSDCPAAAAPFCSHLSACSNREPAGWAEEDGTLAAGLRDCKETSLDRRAQVSQIIAVLGPCQGRITALLTADWHKPAS